MYRKKLAEFESSRVGHLGPLDALCLSDSVMSMIPNVNNRLNGHFGGFFDHMSNSKQSYIFWPIS